MTIEIASLLLAPLRFCLATFLFIISPLTAVVSYFFDLTVSVLQLPVWLVRKLEVIYIYLGVAFLVGISLGFIFSYFSSIIFSAFSLDREVKAPPERVVRKRKSTRNRSPISTAVALIESDRALRKSSFTIPRERGWLSGKTGGSGSTTVTSGRSGMGMGAVEISPLSPTSISPSLSMGVSDLGARQQIFPILEEEDEQEDEVRGRKGRGKKRL
ncbi:hypothetical protein H072_8644 [Dactylellina haptotyla CBS 200.50]|uniref:Uncharacterized protein n=1 Tax=Dactylellina haptotyla (strain CBS 200.50) TaxID=1284197 RepID=S8A4D1_DACHA|nr:hypothetical protein H072_8644 [Dactylellina haptotyla CBS 200.50]